MTDETKIETAETALSPTLADMPADFTVIANSPKEMETAQRSLILWAARKIQAEKELLAEAKEQFEIAKRNKWGSGGWSRRIGLSEHHIEYYRKIKMALEAGYYIVPPFPITVFAVRTELKKPTDRRGWSDREVAETRGLPNSPTPAGLGDYVANRVGTKPFDRYGNIDPITGKATKTTYHAPSYFRPVEFPFKLAKAAVMSETAKAMALKVFDQIGIMGTAQEPKTVAVPDPIVCGQILPWFHKRKPVTFFVAWWLDTATL